MKLEPIGDLFDKASDTYCSEEGCYLGTCPVNCLASLYYEFLKEQNLIMIFGCYKLLQRLSKC